MGNKENQKILVITFSLMTIVTIIIFNLVLVYYSAQQYERAQKYISNHEWSRANKLLKEIPNYKESKHLRAYVEAKVSLQEGQAGKSSTNDSVQKATKYVARIPSNYKGPFAAEVRALRNQLSVGKLDLE